MLDIFYPKVCFECKKTGGYFCNICLAKVPKPKLICPACVRPSVDGATHLKCQRPHSLDGLTSAWEYSGVVRKGLVALKYKFAKDAGTELVEKFATELSGKILPGRAVLVPIPMHKARENWRGFNQAWELANILSQPTGWEVSKDLLVKTRKTKPQTDLKGEERKNNLKGAFKLNHDSRFMIKGLEKQRPFVLLDDVWTTGSTLKECAKVLKRSGAKVVWGLTIARVR